MKNLTYVLPIESDWTTTEIIQLSQFTDAVLAVYETGVNRDELIALMAQYQRILPSQLLQKQFDRDFEKQTGYSIYQTLKQVKISSQKVVKL